MFLRDVRSSAKEHQNITFSLENCLTEKEPNRHGPDHDRVAESVRLRPPHGVILARPQLVANVQGVERKVRHQFSFIALSIITNKWSYTTKASVV